MKPNYQLVKKLTTQLVKLTDLSRRLDEVEIQIGTVSDANEQLFEAILDAIGFPYYEFQARSEDGQLEACYRTKWYSDGLCLEEEEADAFIEKLYTEYNGLLLEQPDLFVEKANQDWTAP